MKIFTLFLLLLTLSFADGYKKIGLIPADINYNKEAAQEFSEILYDAVVNAIAKYNFSQNVPQNMYNISETVMIVKDNKRYKETLLASKKFQKEIKESHIKIKKDVNSYMKKRGLSKLLVMDFNTKKVTRMMRKCKGLCNVAISLVEYTPNAKPLKMKLKYRYSVDTCQLTDKSTNAINTKIASLLR